MVHTLLLLLNIFRFNYTINWSLKVKFNLLIIKKFNFVSQLFKIKNYTLSIRFVNNLTKINIFYINFQATNLKNNVLTQLCQQ